MSLICLPHGRAVVTFLPLCLATEGRGSESKVTAEKEDRAPPSKKRKQTKGNSDTTFRNQRSSVKSPKPALIVGFPEDSDEENLTEEELGMREVSQIQASHPCQNQKAD